MIYAKVNELNDELDKKGKYLEVIKRVYKSYNHANPRKWIKTLRISKETYI